MPTKLSSSAKVFYRRFDCSQIVEQLRSKVDRLRGTVPLTEVVLFGSCAHNRHTVASDIDVLFIYSGPTLPTAYKTIRETLALPKLEAHIYSEAEADSNRSVVDRMIEDGIKIL